MQTTESALNLAERHYEAGRAAKAAGDLEGARAHYAKCLEAWPDSAAARVSLGIVLKRLGRLEEAESGFREAASRHAANAEAHANLGLLLLETRREEAAIPALERALELRPGLEPVKPALVQALLIAGDARRARGAMADAERAYRRVLALAPDRLEALDNLGALLASRGRPEDAAPLFERASVLDPANRATLENLGRALLAKGDARAALGPLERVLDMSPSAQAYSDAGEALRLLQRWPDAERMLRRAVELDPLDPAPRSRLGFCLLDQGRVLEAEVELGRTAALDPGSGTALANHAAALYSCDRAGEAIGLLERALELEPENHFARLTLSLARLKRGDLDQGWEYFEWRWKGYEKLGAGAPRIDAPRWDGEAAGGRVVLLHGEQGLGDELQFVRYAGEVARRGARVWLLTQAPLARLFRRIPEIERVFTFGEFVPRFDLHCPLLSLPGVFGTRLDSIPCDIPYLSVSRGPVNEWRRRIGHEPRLKAGLVWAGGAREDDRVAMMIDARRSMRLADFAPLARVPGVRWFSLQKGAPASQAAAPPEGMDLTDWTADLEDFADTAALVECLDLVVTVDTSVAHLAGALGRPVWLLSRFDGCWRWLTGRADSPWYPTMRVFRQRAPLDWSPPLEEIADALSSLCAGRHAA